MSLDDQFWGDVHASFSPNRCWPWRGARNKAGYGVTTVRGKRELAHRLAFELHNSTPPTALVLHSCDNPPCCNPEHLRDGTHADNMGDKMSRNRQAKGEICGNNKYSRALVDALRHLHAVDGLSPAELATLCRHVPNERYIRNIVNGDAWAWCFPRGACASGLTSNLAFTALREHVLQTKVLRKRGIRPV